MVILFLQVVGVVFGFVFGFVGLVIGQVVGVFVGVFIDCVLIGGGLMVMGVWLVMVCILGVDEGIVIMWFYGMVCIGGMFFWVMCFEEEVMMECFGGKVFGGGGGVMMMSYCYFVNFVVGFCEGEVMMICCVWVDG